MITLQDVATAAGVSKSVASRVLNSDTKARISADTRARVLTAAAVLNYVPDHRARALRRLRAGAIAFVVPDVLINPIAADMLAGVQRTATTAGVAVLLGDIGGTESKSATLAGIIGQGRVDGVIMQRPAGYDDRKLAETIDVNVPVVLCNSTLRWHVGSVIFDDDTAASVATEHLLALGHTRIAFIGGTATHDAARRRAAAFRRTMHEAGLRIDRDWMVWAGWDPHVGERGLAQVLSARRRPTGVVVANVNAALGAASHAARHGITVPRDLSIISIQDSWMARLMSPALTVVKMPLREVGEIATRIILDSIEGAALTDVVVTDPPPVLLVRESTAAP